MSSWTAFKESSQSPALCSSVQNSNCLFSCAWAGAFAGFPEEQPQAELCPSHPAKRGISLMHCLNKGETMSMNN